MANANDVIYVKFKLDRYKIIFTDHGLARMEERGISIFSIKDSIENFDTNYIKDGKEIVEKQIKVGNIRTVFTIKTNHIILITSMILGK